MAGSALVGDDGYIDTREARLSSNEKQGVLLYKVSQSHPRFRRDLLVADLGGLQPLMPHANVVKLMQWWEHENCLYLAEESPPGAPLLSKLLSGTWDDFCERDAAEIAGGVLEGLSFLHSNGIAHRELSVSSVAVGRDDGRITSIKISDVSLASLREVEDAKAMRRSEFPPYHLAPECIVDDLGDEAGPSSLPGDGFLLDVWSLGVIVYTMLSGFPPIRSRDRLLLPQKLREGKVEYGEEVWHAAEMNAARLFVGAALTVEASERKGVKELAGEAWLKLEERLTAPLMVRDRLKEYKSRRTRKHLKMIVRVMTATKRMSQKTVLKEVSLPLGPSARCRVNLLPQSDSHVVCNASQIGLVAPRHRLDWEGKVKGALVAPLSFVAQAMPACFHGNGRWLARRKSRS